MNYNGKELTKEQVEAIGWYYDEVCRQAEANMMITLRLEGMHYAAMKKIMGELQQCLHPNTHQQ